ncbi:MAG: hypothetical protein U9M96_01880 [Thermodesulfobacteriota bacterium]|nr:hypothetical protein [Thermodesulfobacteriota bacterium]
MKEQSIFWGVLVICLVGLFLVGGVFYNGTIGIFSGGIAFCQEEPAEEEEETLQTRPRPDTRPNPMLKGKSSQKVQADGSGGGNVATGAGMKPAGSMQQMRPTMPAQQMRPTMPAQQMRPTAPMHK